MSYAGETLDKKLARGFVYGLIRDYLRGINGAALCLAGPGAHDVGPLDAVAPHLSRIFVDRTEKNLAVAQRRSPGSTIFSGELSETPLVGPIAFANFDFCGQLSGNNLKAVQHVGPYLPNGGVLLITTYRGREKGDLFRRITAVSEYLSDKSKLPESVARAWIVGETAATSLGMPFLTHGSEAADLVRQGADISTRCVVYLGSVDYVSREKNRSNRKSPMLITILSIQSLALATFHSTAINWSFGVDGGAVTPEEILITLDRWCGLGQSEAQFASLLDVPRSTLTAWKAHRTRTRRAA